MLTPKKYPIIMNEFHKYNFINKEEVTQLIKRFT